MNRILASSLFVSCFAFCSVRALAGTPVPPSVLAAINREVKATTHVQACNMVNFSPSYYGRTPGLSGHVAVGIVDIDPENCGVNFVTTSLAVYRVDGGRIRSEGLPAKLQCPESRYRDVSAWRVAGHGFVFRARRSDVLREARNVGACSLLTALLRTVISDAVRPMAAQAVPVKLFQVPSVCR